MFVSIKDSKLNKFCKNNINEVNLIFLFLAYLESITRGTEFNCMKNCVPAERKRFVEETYPFAPDPRPSINCDKQVTEKKYNRKYVQLN